MGKCTPMLVNGEINSNLMKEVKEDEIKQATFQWGTFKEHALDDFNGFFYKKY